MICFYIRPGEANKNREERTFLNCRAETSASTVITQTIAIEAIRVLVMIVITQ